MKSRICLVVIVGAAVTCNTQVALTASFNQETGMLKIPKVEVGSEYYKAELMHNGDLNFTVTNAEVLKSSRGIVGSWGYGYYSGENDYMSLTFYPTGVYIHFENDSDPDCPKGGEVGRYSYDGTILTITESVFDNNGDCGLIENGVLRQLETVVQNDILTICDRTGCNTFEKVQ